MPTWRFLGREATLVGDNDLGLDRREGGTCAARSLFFNRVGASLRVT